MQPADDKFWARHRPYTPVFLPPSLYEAAKKAGYDMTDFVKQELIPQSAD